MATKKKGTKAKATGVVKREISLPPGTKEIVLHIKIGSKTGGKMQMKLMAAASPIDPDPTDDG